MKTLEQRRAAHALERIVALQQRSDDFKKLYCSYVDRLGPAIVMNGLGQALATERAAAGPKPKDECAHQALYDSVNGWLCGGGGIYLSGDLLEAIMEHDQSHYLRAQAEGLAWLGWHKKFCRAMFPVSEGDLE